MKRFVSLVVLALLLQAEGALARVPKPPRRDINFEVTYDRTPVNVGDTVTFIVSFALAEEAKDTVEFARAHLSVNPKVEYVAGDSVWSGYLEKGKTFTFEVIYRFTAPGAWSCNPVVQTYLHETGKGTAGRTSYTSNNGVLFRISDPNASSTEIYYPDPSDSQVIIFRVDNMDSSGIRIPCKIEVGATEGPVHQKAGDSVAPESLSKALVVVIPDALGRTEPIIIAVKSDTTNEVAFVTETGDTLYPNFEALDSIPIKIERAANGKYMFKTKSEKGSYEIIGNVNSESIRFKLNISSTWILDGTFRFDDPFGTNDNRLEVVRYYKLHFDGQQWYIYDESYTDAAGYFSYFSDEPHELVVPISENLYSWVFYAVDGEFNPGSGEDYAYYQHGVAVMNNYSYNDITIPDSFTTIDSLPLAGAFHIINVIRNGYTNFGYGYLYHLVPVYYHNFDSSIQGSYFGSYSSGGTRGIVIMGDVYNNDWDQWDSSVIVHETGHWFMYEQAEMPPNSGGPHVYTMPNTTPGHTVHNLYLAYSEGWANFYSCVGNERPLYFDYDKYFDTVFYFQIERPDPDVPYYLYSPQQGPSSLTPLYEGAHVEGAVDEALWDIYDDIDDGNYYVGPDLWGHNNDLNSTESWKGLAALMDVFWDFDPQPANPDHDYCWNIYEFIHGWRKKGYPVNSTFVNIFEAHNVPVFLPGNVNNVGGVNVADLTYLVDYLFFNGAPPAHPSAADADANCAVNVADLDYIIARLFFDGPEFLAGCVDLY